MSAADNNVPVPGYLNKNKYKPGIPAWRGLWRRHASEMSNCHLPSSLFSIIIESSGWNSDFLFSYPLLEFLRLFPQRAVLLQRNLIFFESWRTSVALGENACILTKRSGYSRVHLGVSRARGLSQKVKQATKSSAVSISFLIHTKSMEQG